MENYRVLISEETIQKRVKELAQEISRDYKNKMPIVICMLKGAVYFFADITRNLTVPVNIEFARLSSYKNNTVGGEMELVANVTANVENKDVLIIEDIVDSGKTLNYYVNLLKQKNPASIKICALLDKKERREVDIKADYVGFEAPNAFVIGYGLDYAQKYRELPFIAEVTNVENL